MRHHSRPVGQCARVRSGTDIHRRTYTPCATGSETTTLREPSGLSRVGSQAEKCQCDRNASPGWWLRATRWRDALSSLTSWSFVAVRQRTADATSFQWLIAAGLRNAKSMPQCLLGGELRNRRCTIWVIHRTSSFHARLRLFAARSPFIDLRVASVRKCRLLLTGPLQGVGLK